MASTTAATVSNQLQSQPQQEQQSPSSRITLLLKPVGDVPQLKTQKFVADGSHTVSWVIQFLQKRLQLSSADSVYIFVSQSFAPSPDHTLSNLHQCFSSSPTSNLVLHYAKTCAWG